MAKKDTKADVKAPVEEKKEAPKVDFVEDLRPDGTVVLRYTDGRVIPK